MEVPVTVILQSSGNDWFPFGESAFSIVAGDDLLLEYVNNAPDGSFVLFEADVVGADVTHNFRPIPCALFSQFDFVCSDLYARSA